MTGNMWDTVEERLQQAHANRPGVTLSDNFTSSVMATVAQSQPVQTAISWTSPLWDRLLPRATWTATAAAVLALVYTTYAWSVLDTTLTLLAWDISPLSPAGF